MKKVCNGRYYNMQKGFEYCSNKEMCGIYVPFERKSQTFRFANIRDFRKCKPFKN